MNIEVALRDAELTLIEKKQLLTLLLESGDIFDFSGKQRKSSCNTLKHKIDTGNSARIKQRPYRISTTERRVIENEVQRMLKEDVIQPSENA
ncbi:transposon Ty3-I Gag-Pol polyprotein [Trichonephila inaurata madagascariensis]|uniref:Transposon Ty3-I Gag-Pol polyprotein n=1 Tax=Trichonephila inaurata madagascariensis TaxID=2747483 RepID=A0A8X6WYB6_9ARAC|nr:transposon Ty3-I Gag-Pol polyprotein [Trichonephila inaurata madagascariensis]